MSELFFSYQDKQFMFAGVVLCIVALLFIYLVRRNKIDYEKQQHNQNDKYRFLDNEDYDVLN